MIPFFKTANTGGCGGGEFSCVSVKVEKLIPSSGIQMGGPGCTRPSEPRTQKKKIGAGKMKCGYHGHLEDGS